MKKSGVRTLILIGLVVGAITYWFQVYNQDTIMGISIWLLIGLGSFIASMVCSYLFEEKPARIALMISAGILSAVLLRIVFDTFTIPGSHNLLPFELLFVLACALPAAFIGSFSTHLIKQIFKNK